MINYPFTLKFIIMILNLDLLIEY
ncbi:unnamed protein product [Callosobruchus maculatus]|uniref:Uncharacterized protein n=1 Tax=Callosobruchus maculatus TaxID=64391 RepID=A0A653CAD9_CALMS|nr:unnamed protein product [Callosobruchus maculatus]